MRKAKRLQGTRRRAALVTAREAIASLVQPEQMADIVAELHNCTTACAELIVKEAWKEIFAADSTMSPAEAKALLKHATYGTFSKAIADKSFGPAIQALKFLAQLDRLTRPETVVMAPQAAAQDEFAGRTQKENEFYAEHGCFPEDYKEPPKPAVPKDPLAALH